MLGKIKKHSSRPTIISWWFCISFTATCSFRQIFQERQHQKLAALPGLNACRGQWDLCWEEMSVLKSFIMVMRLILHWHSPLTAPSLPYLYFLISDPEGKGWKLAFNFPGNLSTSHEISACLSLAFWLGKQAFLPPVLFTHCSEGIDMGSGVHSLSWCSLNS